jgi:hypothetical protein
MTESVIALHFDLTSNGFASVACDQESVVIKTEREGKTDIIEWPIGDAEQIADAIRRLVQQYH